MNNIAETAGAFTCSEILAAAHKKDLLPNESIKSSDACHFFDRIGALLKTGAANKNACDI